MSNSPEHSVVAALVQAGLTVATAESLTAGSLSATIANVPGASHTLLGGVVSYTNDIKTALLGVDAQLLKDQGAVCDDVAQAMAAGIYERFHADIGVSTTGVAGPEPHQGKEVGTVYIGIATSKAVTSHAFHFDGGREQIRQATVAAALSLLARQITTATP